MADNEFQKRRDMEEKQVESGNNIFVLEAVKTLVKMVAQLSKDIRKVREELRNIKNLRPLKEVEE